MMGRGPKYSDEDRETMMEMWVDGATIAEISDEIGRPASGIDSHIKAHRDDFPYRLVRTTEEEREMIADLRAKGWTYRRIGEYMGISETTARKCLCER